MTLLKNYSYAFVVFSSAMLATWILGEMFSVGGFTALEIALLVLFSSVALKIASIFWNAVILYSSQLFAAETFDLPATIQSQGITNNQP